MTKDELKELQWLRGLVAERDGQGGDIPVWLALEWIDDAIKRAAAEPKTPDPGKAARRVFQCIVGSGVLRDKSAEELVGLAIEHLRPSGDMGMLILHEMCSRVHPDWAKDEDSGT